MKNPYRNGTYKHKKTKPVEYGVKRATTHLQAITMRARATISAATDRFDLLSTQVASRWLVPAFEIDAPLGMARMDPSEIAIDFFADTRCLETNLDDPAGSAEPVAQRFVTGRVIDELVNFGVDAAPHADTLAQDVLSLHPFLEFGPRMRVTPGSVVRGLSPTQAAEGFSHALAERPHLIRLMESLNAFSSTPLSGLTLENRVADLWCEARTQIVEGCRVLKHEALELGTRHAYLRLQGALARWIFIFSDVDKAGLAVDHERLAARLMRDAYPQVCAP